MNNPFEGNPLQSRGDFQKAVRDLMVPLLPHFSPGGARLRLGVTISGHQGTFSEMEAFGRPLWGVVPLAAGGGSWDGWSLYQKGLKNGHDPRHEDYWGRYYFPSEYASLGLGLSLVPEILWNPLDPETRKNFSAALYRINEVELFDNNWLFWRVLGNLGLKGVGENHDAKKTAAALDRLEEFYLGEGWYYDGINGQPDYYIPFAMQFYALLYAKLAEKDDPARSARFKERAALFAQQFVYWFAADGAAIPYGRSLMYRFALGAFWGALAFAGVEALPWGVIKGIYVRHLQWWAKRPIFHPSGVLSVGYGYAQDAVGESYSGPGAMYWAMKFFIPLALPESHPFWRAEVLPLPILNRVSVQKHPGMVFMRDSEHSHVSALVSSPFKNTPKRNWPEKYGKFAYSTAFGFSIPAMASGLANGAHDNMLALSEEGEYFRVRKAPYESKIEGEVLYSKWRPFPDVTVETWIIPAPPWHVRVHRIVTGRKLVSAEAGYALPLHLNESENLSLHSGQGPGEAWVDYPDRAAGIWDLYATRAGEIICPESGTNILHPMTCLPTLRGEHGKGEHVLGCAVLGLAERGGLKDLLPKMPRLQRTAKGFEIGNASPDGHQITAVSLSAGNTTFS